MQAASMTAQTWEATASALRPAQPQGGLNGSLCRALDILLSLTLLVFIAPLMVAITLAVWLQDGGSPIFGHSRIGRDGRRFKCLKFRSMVVDADQRLRELLAKDAAARAEWAKDHKLRRDPRITSLGSFLRKSSLDELPQLFNVLRGEMSLVGPRPIVQDEAARYGRYFAEYCAVRPGITGLWQVSGRNETDYRRRVALDVLFTRRTGLRLYFTVLIATVPAVVLRKGAF